MKSDLYEGAAYAMLAVWGRERVDRRHRRRWMRGAPLGMTLTLTTF